MIVELFESLSVTLQSLSKECHEMLVASHNPDHCTESTMRQQTRTMCVAVKVGNAHLTLQSGRCKERGGRSWGKGGRKDPSQQKANRKAGSFVVLNTVQSQEGGSS